MKSNHLTVLAGKIRDHLAASDAAEREAMLQALAAGYALCEAKDACKHGEWLPFLKEAGVGERKAQRYMRLAKSGLKPDTVSDLGGIRATLEWAEGLRLPSNEEYLRASVSDTLRGFVWNDERGYGISVLELDNGNIRSFRKPIIIERAVFPILYGLLEHRYTEMTFETTTRCCDDFHQLLTGDYCNKCGSKMDVMEEMEPITIYYPFNLDAAEQKFLRTLGRPVA